MSARRTVTLSVARPVVLAALTVLIALAAAACGASSPVPSPGRPSSSAAPVPRAPGASVTPGGPAGPGAPAPAEKAQCTGWPSAPADWLPRSFHPASVLRCVTGTVSVPGKGQWTAAILEKSDQDLAPLAEALTSVSGRREPGHMCPQFIIVPPQVVLVGKDGAMIRPRFPVTGCGQIQQKALSALEGLHWQTVSRRLLGKVSS